MEISAKKFRQLCEQVPEPTCRSLLKSMKEFGYTDLTLDEVKEGMRKALAGKSDEVISIWIRNYLNNGVID